MFSHGSERVTVFLETVSMWNLIFFLNRNHSFYNNSNNNNRLQTGVLLFFKPVSLHAPHVTLSAVWTLSSLCSCKVLFSHYETEQGQEEALTLVIIPIILLASHCIGTAQLFSVLRTGKTSIIQTVGSFRPNISRDTRETSLLLP